MKTSLLLAPFVLAVSCSQAFDLASAKLVPVDVSMSWQEIAGKRALQVVKNPKITEVDEPTFVKLPDINFTNGTLEIKVLSRLLPEAPEHARGFIGVAFRINEDNTKFESIYLRPSNGRADKQLQRNRSTQYFSYPDFKFDRLRKEAAGQYESYVDIGLNEWITMKIHVQGNCAKLFVSDAVQPVLVVNDLKHGPEASGAIGLWVDVGTEGYFADLKVQP